MSVDIPDAKLLGETLAHMAYMCVYRRLDRSVIYSCGDSEIEFVSEMIDHDQIVVVREHNGAEMFSANRSGFEFAKLSDLQPISAKIYNFAKAFAHDILSRV